MEYYVTITKYKKHDKERVVLTFNEKELKRLKKHVVKTCYDGSLEMKDGSIVEIEEI